MILCTKHELSCRNANVAVHTFVCIPKHLT